MRRHGVAPALTRAVLALGVALSWQLATLMVSLPPDAAPQGCAAAWRAAQTLAAHRTAASVLMVLLLAAFTTRRWQVAGGLGAVALFRLYDWASNCPPGLEHAHYLPPTAMLVWALTVAWKGRTRGGEAWARHAALAAIAGIYTVAGLCKLLESGPGWINDYHLRVLTAAEAYKAAGPLAPWLTDLRLALAGSRAFAWIGSLAGLFIELGALALVFPRTRLYALAGLAGLHAMIYLTMGIWWPDWYAVILVLALPWRPARRKGRARSSRAVVPG